MPEHYSEIWTKGMQQLTKALTYTAAGAYVPKEIDPLLQILADYKNPVRQNVPRKSWGTDKWTINRRTEATATGMTFPGWISPDTGTIPEATGTPAQFEFLMRTFAVEFDVRTYLQAAGQNLMNVFQNELEAKMLEYKNHEDFAYVNGTSSATVPPGLSYLTTSNQRVLTTTTAGGAAMTLDDIDYALDKNKGNPNMIIGSRRSRREMAALLQSQQQFVNVTEVKGGFKLMTYNGIPYFVDTSVLNTWTFDGSTNGAATGGTASSLHFIDTDYYWIGVLQELKYVPLAKTSALLDQAQLISFQCPVLSNPIMISELSGIWSGGTITD